MRVSTPSFPLASLALLTLLAACGGGGGSDSGDTNVSSNAQTSGTTNTTSTIATTGTAGTAGAGTAATGGTAAGSTMTLGAPPAQVAAEGDGKPAPGLGGVVPDDAQATTGSGITRIDAPTPSPTLKTMGSWTPLFDWPVMAIHAALTPDGRVMSFGVDYSAKGDWKFYYDVWDPTLGIADDSHTLLENTTGTFLFCSAQILIPTTGEMLVLGGDLIRGGRPTSTGVRDVNLFNPADNSLKRDANPMQLPRWYGSATTLPSGEIYIQGGTSGEEYPEVRHLDGTSRPLTSIKTNETFMSVNGENRYFDNNYPRNFVAPNGKIFGFDPHYMYEIDPKGTGSIKMFGAHWDIPHSDPVERAKETNFYRGWSGASTAALIRPGLILQFGGMEPRATLIDINSGKPELIDLPKLSKNYYWASSTVMADGNVLVSGGSTKNVLLDTIEPINQDAGEINYDALIFNPETRQFTTAAKFDAIRIYHSVTLLLPDGTVLSSGGGAPGPVQNLNAQIYRPPYLFNDDGTLAERPVLEGADGGLPLVVDPAAAFSVNSPNAADIGKVTLIKTGAVTHAFDMEQRYQQVDFKVNGNALEIQLPANKYLTPPGYYMVFAFNKAGVPSKARMIRINPTTNP
ncbi:MAG: galactose oxidase early set domain-containing protein [Lautropia sp.]|nr:galactose oxidase early set domain-containing protein [Lautropia sp.]